MLRLLCAALTAGAALCGCALPPIPVSPAALDASKPRASAARYHCDHGTEFGVRFGEDTAIIDDRGHAAEVLLRDAGGVTPQQTVYSNPRLRAEFGLGAAGREARLHYLPEQRMAQCVRD
jgi:hypothetical protein